MKIARRVCRLPLLGAILASASLLPPTAAAQTRPPAADRLKIFFIDVEGGQATLFVTPDKHSLLIDTGWPGNNGRDAARIVAAAKQAGITRLNYVLITHYHTDHVGGLPQLVAKIPVDTFLDHGPNRELDHGITEDGYAKYQQVLTSTDAKHITAHPGQTLDIGALTLKVISADGQLLHASAGSNAQANPACAASAKRPPDQTENSRSLGVELTYGRLKLLDLGDLTWDKEMDLMCPANPLGHVDVYMVSHHGWNQSSSPALVHALHARVAIMDNGESKGGSLPTFETLASSPGLENLWQLHYSAEAGTSHNAPAQFIANLKGTDPGNYLELTGAKDGSFTMLNSRTGETRTYPASGH